MRAGARTVSGPDARALDLLTRRPASIVGRLWAGLGAFALLVVAAGALVYTGFRQQADAVHSVAGYLHPLDVANLQLRADFATSQAALGAYILTRDATFVRAYQRATEGLSRTVTSAQAIASGPQLANLRLQRREFTIFLRSVGRAPDLTPGSLAFLRLATHGVTSATAFYKANYALHAQLQRASAQAIARGRAGADRALVIAAICAGLAALLGLVAAVGTVRTVARPLRGLAGVLRRLAAGDHAARAAVTGPAEISQVASSLNALADESDRLRAQEDENSRLRAMAREAGVRIRDNLLVAQLLQEAQATIEEHLDADHVSVHLVKDGEIGPPAGGQQVWRLPADFFDTWPRESRAQLTAAFHDQASLVINDLSRSSLHPRIHESLWAAGVTAQVITPFGIGSEMLGIIVATRTRQGHPWSGAEVAAIESISADVGRGLHHARMYEAESRLVSELRLVDRTKSDFLAAVSHELRTPLTSIAGYVEMLRDAEVGPLTDQQELMLGAVQRNAVRLRLLIEDVLTLSKIESGAFKTSMQPIDLAKVITEGISAARPGAEAKGLTIETSGPADGVIVAGDAGQLNRLAASLLSNATKFTPRGGTVTVSYGSEGPVAVLRVRDTGIGIPAIEQKGVFTRFFRASNAVRASIPGTGLGLAITRTIVANHGGDVTVDSAEGTGTTVTVKIPLLAASPPVTHLAVPAAGEVSP